MMNKLFIDTSSNKIIVALMSSKNYSLKIIDTNKNMVEIFKKKINNFLLENNTEIQKIKKVYLINGPGNFSGIRIGCIFANVLKLTNNVKLYYLSSCEFLKLKENQIALIDAKGGNYYFHFKNFIKIQNFLKIKKFAEKNHLEIIEGYNSFDFWKLWKKNEKKFILTDLVRPNYIKRAI